MANSYWVLAGLLALGWTVFGSGCASDSAAKPAIEDQTVADAHKSREQSRAEQFMKALHLGDADALRGLLHPDTKNTLDKQKLATCSRAIQEHLGALKRIELPVEGVSEMTTEENLTTDFTCDAVFANGTGKLEYRIRAERVFEFRFCSPEVPKTRIRVGPSGGD